MKLLICILLSTSVFCQIPNNGFETWVTVNGYETPSSWDNLNQITFNQTIFTCIKKNPGNPGLSYLHLVSKAVAGKGIVPGIVVSGKMDTVTYKPISGYSFTNRPQNLSYNLQYMPSDPSDSSGVKVLLTKWNTALGKRDTIAIGARYYNAMAHSWFLDNVLLTYESGENPDSACIVISSSSINPQNGSYIYIDNLQFNGSVVGISEFNLAAENISIYPNPANDYVTININEIDINKSNTLQVYDVLGKIIYISNITNSLFTINTSQWSKGIYTINFTQNNQRIHHKLIIN